MLKLFQTILGLGWESNPKDLYWYLNKKQLRKMLFQTFLKKEKNLISDNESWLCSLANQISSKKTRKGK